jgi:hypothetical protein
MVASSENLASTNRATRFTDHPSSRIVDRRCARLNALRAMLRSAQKQRGSTRAVARVINTRSMHENRAIDRRRVEDRHARGGDSYRAG